jgi:hypothetical protein
MLVLEGIEIHDLSLSWSDVGGDNLVMNIAGGPSRDRVTFISMNDDRLAGFISCPCPLLNRPLESPKVAIEQTSGRRPERSSIQGSGIGLSLSVRKIGVEKNRRIGIPVRFGCPTSGPFRCSQETAGSPNGQSAAAMGIPP